MKETVIHQRTATVGGLTKESFHGVQRGPGPSASVSSPTERDNDALSVVRTSWDNLCAHALGAAIWCEGHAGAGPLASLSTQILGR